MELSLTQELSSVSDVRHQVRQLKWFRTSFSRGVQLLSQQSRMEFEIAGDRLTAAFLDWVEAFSAQKAYSQANPADFTVFAGGLLLRELVRHDPVTLKGEQPAASASGGFSLAEHDIVSYWPQGFLYTSYCVNIIAAVTDQDFHKPIGLTPAVEDLRTWSSFRENTNEQPSLAIGFLDVFLGNEPNWVQPDWAPARPHRSARRLAAS